jgi:tRNA(Met) C34 N-acetyltransferase TmcA
VNPTQTNPFVEFLNLYRNDPVLFVREVLGVEPDQFQADLLREIAAGTRRISVRSGHGVGKSTVASWAMLWYLLTRLPVKVVVTAPTTAQLFDALFAELKRWVGALPPVLNQLLDVKSDKIELRRLSRPERAGPRLPKRCRACIPRT